MPGCAGIATEVSIPSRGSGVTNPEDWTPGNLLKKLPVCRDLLALLGVLILRKKKLHGQHLVRIETEIDPLDLQEAAQQQTGSNQQY
jgi:hypothetical protein